VPGEGREAVMRRVRSFLEDAGPTPAPPRNRVPAAP
jgi:hypothetical protein